VLVDGEFVLEKKNISLRFRGSENQRIIDVQESLKSGEVVLTEFMN
jgi:anaerobic ribonucleoside-triphosphate reductase activating protein